MQGNTARHSRVKNIFGTPTKEKLLGISPNVQSSESSGVAASFGYAAFPWDVGGGGVVAVIDHSDLGNRSAVVVHLKGHRGLVQDVCFSPFYDSILASASDDTTLRIWEVPDRFVNCTVQEPRAILTGHDKRILCCSFNSVAESILASGSQDGTLRVWNVETASQVTSIPVGEMVQSVKWNLTGSLLACTTKDKCLHILDPRGSDKTVVASTQAHEGSKGSKVEWCGGNISPEHILLTAGFEKGPGRDVALWDLRSLAEPLRRFPFGRGTGSVFPYWDGDTGIMLLPSRGDSSIRLFEIAGTEMYACSDFRSIDPARGFGFIPKRAVDVTKCEIARCLKVDSANSIQPIQFIVPRRSSEFQEDIFPPCISGEPALTASEWISERKVAKPCTANMKPDADGTTPFAPRLLAGAPFASAAKAVEARRGSVRSSSPESSEEIERLRITIAQLTEKNDTLARDLAAAREALSETTGEVAALESRNRKLEQLFQTCKSAMHVAAQRASAACGSGSEWSTHSSVTSYAHKLDAGLNSFEGDTGH